MSHFKKYVSPKHNFTGMQLKEAFDLIKNKQHWKGRIKATIPDSQFDVCKEAVEFFTGTELKVTETLPNGKIRVESVGYWGGPAAG